MQPTWAPAPGEPVVLSLDAGASGIPVRLGSRSVSPARETPIQKFVYTPTIWGSTVAGLAVFLLLGTAFATGTIRPAPPPLPTPLPGAPTPTPDSRPFVSIGGLQLVAPAPPPTPVPAPTAVPDQAAVGQTPVPLNLGATTDPQSPQTTTTDPQTPAAPACNNFLGIGCAGAVPPRVVPPPVTKPQQQVPQQTGAPGQGAPAVEEPPVEQTAPQTPEQTCNNFLGLGCASSAAPAPTAVPQTAPAQNSTDQTAPQTPPDQQTGPCPNVFGQPCASPPTQPPSQPTQAPQNPVLPVPSPRALLPGLPAALGQTNPSPPQGSPMEAALQAASVATSNLNRALGDDSDAGSR